MGPGSDCTACHDPVAHIAAGGHHSAALCRRLGRCYTWGCNSQGQLGHGTAGHMNCAVPALVRALDGVPLVSVAAGLAHTAVVSRDGDVYTWGCNCTGELGLREEKPEEQRSLLPAQQPQQKQVQPQLQQQQQERLGAGGGWHQRLASAVAPVLLEHPCLDEEHVTQVRLLPNPPSRNQLLAGLIALTSTCYRLRPMCPITSTCAPQPDHIVTICPGRGRHTAHGRTDGIWTRYCLGPQQTRPVWSAQQQW